MDKSGTDKINWILQYGATVNDCREDHSLTAMYLGKKLGFCHSSILAIRPRCTLAAKAALFPSNYRI